MATSSNQIVEMKAVTWQKDSHGLFDYETKCLSVKKYRILSSCNIFRNDQEISIVYPKSQEPHAQVQNQNDKLLTAYLEQMYQAQFDINPCNIPDQTQKEAILNNEAENENFLIVRSLKNGQGQQKGYVLTPGDILKLGRIEYAVIEMKNSKGEITSIKDLFCSDQQCLQQRQDSSIVKTCKICLFENESDDDPFISPCLCKGSCEYVHFNCLKQWIDSKSQKKDQGSTSVHKWKKLECEVCQWPLPKAIEIDNQKFYLAEVERPQQPYIILESISREKKVSKGLYLIKTPFQEPIKLGRGHQCDVRISDISVSRLHAFIKYENDNFVIIDNNSKFGTLVKLSKSYPIQNEKIAVQIGRTVLTFVMKPSQVLPFSDNQKLQFAVQKQHSFDLPQNSNK